jgi:hypothetical protein
MHFAKSQSRAIGPQTLHELKKPKEQSFPESIVP